MSCGVGHRRSLDLALLWLWCRLAATAPIRPLAWEPPNAVGVALEKTKKKRKKKETHGTWRTDFWLPRGKGREWDGLGVWGS